MWTTVSDSPYDHEREALAYLRRNLPDREPYRIWALFDFVAPNGLLHEVDALAITDNGVYLIEIKSHPGAMSGDGATWQWTPPRGRGRRMDNPRLLANRKAKALKSRLAQTKAFANAPHTELPYVTEVIFLSAPDLTAHLSPPGRQNVYGRRDSQNNLPDIVEALTSLEPSSTGPRRRRIDRPAGRRIARAVEQMGIRERTSRGRINEYRIVEPLEAVDADRDTGIAYQDFLVEHSTLEGDFRRARIYPLEHNATTEQREVAERAARREFQHLRQLKHPGIASPVAYVDHERGPCLLFEHDFDEVPLDRWLTEPGRQARLGKGDRLELVRKVAEALAHAHGSGVYHRALCPSAVLVKGGPGGPDDQEQPLSLRLANWHAGARVTTGDSSPGGTITDHLEALAGGDAALYRAPEHGQPAATPVGLDVFSLGCLTGYIMTAVPPAATPGKLRKLLDASGCVDVTASGDGVDDQVVDLVKVLTDRWPDDRPHDMQFVLKLLDDVEDAWTAPDEEDNDSEPLPNDARRGDTLSDGRFAVCGRIGSGSTAVALLVKDREDGDRVGVLKIARTPDLNERISVEAAVLDKLHHHQAIVRLRAGPLQVGGHTALLVDYAGSKEDAEAGRGDPETESSELAERKGRTLASRIGTSLGSEMVERFGEDLLEAVRHLEQVGVAHRDIKPDNLGVAPRGNNDELHLMLFDFSLAVVPADRLDVGTEGYIDPFLGRPGRGAWDPAAERYAAAVVLYELCTDGAKPIYGDGRTAPAYADADPTVDAALFEASVAPGLKAFFEKALAVDAGDRHDTAADMLWAWRAACRPARQPAAGAGEPPEEGTFAVPPGTTRSTPLRGTPLSARAVNALERQDVYTVGDLLALPARQWLALPGVGAQTRRELRVAVAELREALAADGDLSDDIPLTVAADHLVPRVQRPADVAKAAVLRRYLALPTSAVDGSEDATAVDDTDDIREGGEPPTQVDLAAAAEVSRARVSQILTSARGRWEKQRAVTALRRWVAQQLPARGGVMALSQLVQLLVDERPSSGDEGADRRAAVAMLRAALAVEGARTLPRWVRRSLDSGVTVLAAEVGTDPDRVDGPEGQTLADYAADLAWRTGELVDQRTVVPRLDLVTHLQEVAPPEGAAPLGDAALAELGAALCPDAAVNGRLELYPRRLPALDALTHARGAFVAAQQVEPEMVVSRVRARFPEAEVLPGRPELDGLLREAGIGLAFDEATGTYRLPEASTSSTGSGSWSRSRTGARSRTPREADPVADFEARLQGSTDNGGLLVLMTHRQYLQRATAGLARFPVTMMDVDAGAIAEAQRLTESGAPSWEQVVRADAAGPDGPEWQYVRRLMGEALDTFSARLAAHSGAACLVNCGLLARYDRMDLVARWRETVQHRDASLRALWMLVATSEQSEVPLLDNRPVPVVSLNERARIPSGWLPPADAEDA